MYTILKKNSRNKNFQILILLQTRLSFRNGYLLRELMDIFCDKIDLWCMMINKKHNIFLFMRKYN